MNRDKNTYEEQDCNQQEISFKRALVRGLKGTFCKPIGRLLEAKRACIQNHDVKK